MSKPTSPPVDEGDALGDDPQERLAQLRRRAPTGDNAAVDELMAWARRRADELLGTLSPDSELLALLREDEPAPGPVARTGGTQRGIPIPARTIPPPAPEPEPEPAPEPAPEPEAVEMPPPTPSPPIEERPARHVSLDALPAVDIASADELEDARVMAVGRSPLARLLPRDPVGGAETPRPAAPPRRHPRYDLEHPVRIHYGDWSDFVELYTKDISQGGMFVRSPEPPALHTRVAVRLTLPGDAGVLKLEGEVVHVMGGQGGEPATGFGLQFDGLSSRRRELLQQLVEHARATADGAATSGPTLKELGLGTASQTSTSLRLTMTREELRELEQLKSDVAGLDEKDDLALLGVSEETDAGGVERAFEVLAEKWDPQRWLQRPSPEVEELAAATFRRIEQAFLRVAAAKREAVPAAAAPVLAPREEDRVAPADAAPRRTLSMPVPTPPSALSAAPPAAPSPEPSRARSLVERLLQRGNRLAQKLTTPHVPDPPPMRVPGADFNRLVGRGFEQLSGRDYESAIASFSVAVEQRPDSTKAKILLLFAEARLAVQQKRLVDARAKYEAVLEIDPENATAKRDLVMLACLE